MTRYVLQNADLDYKDRLLQLNMLPLTMRREYEDIVFFWKCLHGMYDINVYNSVKFYSDSQHVTRLRMYAISDITDVSCITFIGWDLLGGFTAACLASLPGDLCLFV